MHFTYVVPKIASDLQQGDLLSRQDAFCDLIRQFHPYYLKQDYTHFLVLTQSGDLVRRQSGKVTAPYITLAAVRPLVLALEREAEKWRAGELQRAAGVTSRKKP